MQPNAPFPPVNGSSPFPPVDSSSPFPPVNGAAPEATLGAPPKASFPVNGAAPIAGGGFGPPPGAPTQAGPSAQCMKQFLPLRAEAVRRGKLIKAASDRHASAVEACKLIGSFSRAEIRMIKYVESHAATCGIPRQVTGQLKAGHKHTEMMERKVCAVARQMRERPSGPSLSEVLGSAVAAPEARSTKKGGSTFDTLSGNVLNR
ncbi:MAG: hypothetical protein ACREDL_20690 [Bradyrhizobium sp.]